MALLTKIAPEVLRRLDGWVNMFTGLGEALSDKTAQTRMRRKEPRQPQYYEDLFHEDAIARRVLELPAREMVRKGFEFKTSDPNFDDTPVMHAWRTLPVQGTIPAIGADVAIMRATALARATGGAAIILGVDDGSTDVAMLQQPLNIEAVKELRWVRVVSRTSLTPRRWYPYGDKYGQCELWNVHYDVQAGQAAPAELLVHESRLILFDGIWATDRRRIEQQGFGLSAYEQLEDGLAKMGTSFQALSTMLVDVSQAVMKIKDLHGLVTMSDEGDAAIRKRLRLVDYSRSVAHAVALDADSESFEYASRTLAGVSDIFYAGMFWLSAQTGIPVTLLFGRSPAGLNATGDNDVRFFYDLIASDQVTYLKSRQMRLMQVALSAKAGPTKGIVPPSWDIEHCPLWELTETEQATVRLTTAQADQIYITTQTVAPEEVAIARFGGDKYSTDLTIDADSREMPDEPDDGTGAGPDAGNGTNVQQTVLNGAQVTSLVDVVKAVASGDLPRDSGVAIVKLSFGLDDQAADDVLGEAGKSFKVEKPQPPALGSPPPPGTLPPADKPPPKTEPFETK